MKKLTTIRKYTSEDIERLLTLIEREGEEWTYWQGDNRAKYQKALDNCVTYLVFEGETLCGYARCRGDDGFGVYVFDLLVDKQYRGKEYGRLLMEQVCRDFPNEVVYVMGGTDIYSYYGDKLGYKEEGKVYIVNAL
jgi:ribosomal protein S18 acetylase RimI-like enzyme